MVAERGGRRRRPKTPLEHTATAKSYADAAKPAEPPPPDLALPDDLLYFREHAYAVAAAEKFKNWLLNHVAYNRIPLDGCIIPVTLLPIYVEESLLARIHWPEPARDEDVGADPDYWAPQDESDAMACGLTVRRTRSRERDAATLPGCHGKTPGGRPCPTLRRYGERFCGACRRIELERMRRCGEGG